MTYDNAILTFYKKDYSGDVNKVERNEHLLEEADWVGLEDFLKHIESKSFKLENVFSLKEDHEVK